MAQKRGNLRLILRGGDLFTRDAGRGRRAAQGQGGGRFLRGWTGRRRRRRRRLAQIRRDRPRGGWRFFRQSGRRGGGWHILRGGRGSGGTGHRQRDTGRGRDGRARTRDADGRSRGRRDGRNHFPKGKAGERYCKSWGAFVRLRRAQG